MEEALEILWTYARREPLDSNGETVVPTINNSIAAIRIIMRLEGWAMGSEKRKMNSEKQATHDLPASKRRGKVRESGVCEQFAPTLFTIDKFLPNPREKYTLLLFPEVLHSAPKHHYVLNSYRYKRAGYGHLS